MHVHRLAQILSTLSIDGTRSNMRAAHTAITATASSRTQSFG